MTTENWLTLSIILVSIVSGTGVTLYRVIMRDVKALIKEQFSILREEKIKELYEDNLRKEAKISQLQDWARDSN